MPIWWVLIFFVMVIFLFCMMSSLSESLVIPVKSFSLLKKEVKSWLK